MLRHLIGRLQFNSLDTLIDLAFISDITASGIVSKEQLRQFLTEDLKTSSQLVKDFLESHPMLTTNDTFTRSDLTTVFGPAERYEKDNKMLTDMITDQHVKLMLDLQRRHEVEF